MLSVQSQKRKFKNIKKTSENSLSTILQQAWKVQKRVMEKHRKTGLMGNKKKQQKQQKKMNHKILNYTENKISSPSGPQGPKDDSGTHIFTL